MESIPERTFQEYILENFEQFQEEFQKRFNSRIDYVRDNKDRYPDLYFVLKDRREIPVEVEWKTSNFDHDPRILVEDNGYIFVGIIEPHFDVGSIKQIKVNLKGFQKWYIKTAERRIKKATDSLNEIDQARLLPKLWFTYLGQKGNAIEHFQTALKHQIWGVQEGYDPTTKNQISDVKERDLIAFVLGGKGFSGRSPLDEWRKKSFKGYFEKIYVFRVTRKYYKESTKIWETKPDSKWKNELFPHRFGFNRNPLLILKNIRINKLGLTSIQELHKTTFANFRECEPNTLVDILHYAEQPNVEEYRKELEQINQSS